MKWRGRWYFIKPWKKFFSNLFSTWEKCVSLNWGNFCRTTLVHVGRVFSDLVVLTIVFSCIQSVYMWSSLHTFHSFTEANRVSNCQCLIHYSVSQSPLIFVSWSVSFAGRDIVPVRLHWSGACVLVGKFTDHVLVFRIHNSVRKIIVKDLRILCST